MYYGISVSSVPEVGEVSIMSRKTVWACADTRNILVLILENSCVFIIENNKYVAKEGQAILIPAGQPYIRMPHEDRESRFIYIHFETSEPVKAVTSEDAKEHFKALNAYLVTDAPRRGEEKPSEMIFLTQTTEVRENDRPWIRDLLEEMHSSFRTPEHYHGIYTGAKLLELLVYLGKLTASDLQKKQIKTATQFPIQVKKAIFYIHENYNKKISVQTLCRVCNVSPQHLVRLFRKYLDATPIEYINRHKISYAIEMLRSTNLSVNEIAFELGFDDPNYFRRLFKKHKNASPADYRKYMRGYGRDEHVSRGR